MNAEKHDLECASWFERERCDCQARRAECGNAEDRGGTSGESGQEELAEPDQTGTDSGGSGLDQSGKCFELSTSQIRERWLHSDGAHRLHAIVQSGKTDAVVCEVGS
jgi:hypothetical protein